LTSAGARPSRGAKRSDPRRSLGRLGEDLAAAHFAGLGFSALARNLRTRAGEIDLIVFDGDTLVFAEVKTLRVHADVMRPDPHERPLQWLRHRQRARVRRLAAAWLNDASEVRPRARTIRFDAVGVTVDRAGRLMRLEHIEAAW